jgi:hypothetical protein
MAFRLEIVTPEGKAFADDITGVVLPGALGEMGVLPSHANLVSTLEPGELRYTRDGQTHELAVGAGFVEITGSHVNVRRNASRPAPAISRTRKWLPPRPPFSTAWPSSDSSGSAGRSEEISLVDAFTAGPAVLTAWACSVFRKKHSNPS